MLKPEIYLSPSSNCSLNDDSPVNSSSRILAHKRSCILPAITTIGPGVLAFHKRTNSESGLGYSLPKPSIQVNLRGHSTAKESFAAFFAASSEMRPSDGGTASFNAGQPGEGNKNERGPGRSLTYFEWLSVLRSPRPFIMIRFIREIVSFKLPKNRIQQIIKRSSQQIQNVTIFFVFFMSLYSIMGVQLFGRMESHCVLNGTDPRNVTIADLAIPDTMCSQRGGGGYICPPHMVCMKLDMNSHRQGFYGMFNDFASSLFTVYMAASQEGWVYVLYDCLDTYPSYLAFFYFVTLIFFLAWLVKNVFIAVITETFAEIRVQFSEMWATREKVSEEGYSQKLEKTDSGWRLIENSDAQDHDSPNMMYTLVKSSTFQICIMAIVLLNALINASFVHYHDESDISRKVIYYYVEVCFTILFNIEFILKVYALSWGGYIKRGQHKFETILCLGSSANVVSILYKTNVFTYFQVFRLARLIKASPMLEDFVYKIFGPGKKLGGLVIFTMVVLLLTSAISLQLFCYVPNLDKFITFPHAFMSMFQIITQEGWTDVVVEILRATNETFVPFVAIYFVGYHLFVTLIVLSLFVAVILDNLEMDEELKKVKQLKAREETTCMRTTLPLRLRVFETFPGRPQMVSLKKMNNDFPMPRIRDSFTRSFADEESYGTYDDEDLSWSSKTMKLMKTAGKVRSTMPTTLKMRQVGSLTKKNGLSQLLELSNKSRVILSDSNQFIAGRGNQKDKRESNMNRSNKNSKNSTAFNSMKINQIYEQMKENGDCRPTDSAPKNNLKQGEIDIRALQQRRAQAEFTRNRIEEEMRENHPFFDRPLFAVGRDSKLRQLCKKIVYAKYTPQKIDAITGKPILLRYKQLHSLVGLMTYLDWAMVIITSISCYSMLYESPWPTSGENLIFMNFYLQITEYIFILSMTFELAIKIIANGLFFTPKAVVRDVGGVMTIFIYITSVGYLLWMPKHVEINSFAQLVMIFRALRPLRIYTLIPHIRRVVVELCKGFKEILLVTILLILLMFIFASFGVQIVGGKLAACNDHKIKDRDNCTGLFHQKLFVTRMDVFGKNSDELHPQLLVPRVWTNPRNFNFDHIGNAMLALFETLSYKGWNVIRDILWVRAGPWAVLFIHVYVFIGCMIGLTLFVGVVIANYMQNRGTALLTVDQRRWHDLKARLRMAQPLHVPPKPAESARYRNRIYEYTMSRNFKQFFVILVLVNSATLVVPWNTDEETRRSTTLYVTTLISAISNLLFTVEIVLKAFAYTIKGFWQSRRNRIDLLITVCGLIWIVIHFMMTMIAKKIYGEDSKKFTYTFGYIVVIARFFTIAGRKSTLKMLMLTVVMSMVRSLFIIAAMFLLVLFYAYTGVILFGMVKYGQAVSKHVNFRNGKEALVVLFRSVTGEDWNDILHDCMRSAPFCYWKAGSNYWETDCGNYYGAIIYFCSFYLIITYIVLNLLVAIIMENFSLFYSSEEDALLSYADIRNYQQVWNMLDTEQKRSIPVRKVKFLLRLLKGRLEVDPSKDSKLFKHMCYEMEKLHNGDDVSFHDILYMLSYRSVDIRKSLQLEELLQREELEYIIEEDVAKRTIREWLEGCLRKSKLKNPLENSLINQMRTTLIPQSSVGLQSNLTPSSLSASINSNLSVAQDIPLSGTINSGFDGKSNLSLSGSKFGINLAFDDSQIDVANRPNAKSPNALINMLPRRSNVQSTIKRTKSKKRRSSIPELMGEAKKMVLGGVTGRMKSLSIHSPAGSTQSSSTAALLLDPQDGGKCSLIETALDYSSNSNLVFDNTSHLAQSSKKPTNPKHFQVLMNLPPSSSQNPILSSSQFNEALTEVEENSDNDIDDIQTRQDTRKDSLDIPTNTLPSFIKQKSQQINEDDSCSVINISISKDNTGNATTDPEDIKCWWDEFTKDGQSSY
uniref:Sodium leak channel non-selective protein n=1 Tax=Rhabditophanes sp. KR3021 TaxID=114890 RepID=A0AC35TIY1_9BILA